MKLPLQYITTCDGQINNVGICEKCFQPAQTTSSFCGRQTVSNLLPQEEQKPERKKSLEKIGSEILNSVMSYTEASEVEEQKSGEYEKVSEFLNEHLKDTKLDRLEKAAYSVGVRHGYRLASGEVERLREENKDLNNQLTNITEQGS